MAVSLDTLLASQSKAAQQVAKRADFDVSADTVRASERFSDYVEKAPEKVKEAYKGAEAQSEAQPKQLDDYRKEVKDKYEEVVSDVKAAPASKESKKEDASSDVSTSVAAGEDKQAVQAATQKEKDSQTVEEVVQATKPVSETQVKSAEERGVENILNVALTGSAEGEKVIDPKVVKTEEVLARGKEIIESGREAGALILDQLQGVVSVDGENSLVTAGGQEEPVDVQQVLNQQFLAVNNQASEQNTEINANAAVNVARQSRLVVKQNLPQVSAQGAQTVEVAEQAAVKVASALAKGVDVASAGQPQRNQTAEQVLASLEVGKQVAQQQSHLQQQQQQQTQVGQQNTQTVSQQLAAAQNSTGQQSGSGLQQQANGGNAALQKGADVLLDDGSQNADALLVAKPAEGAPKVEGLTHLNNAKFSEYVKFSEIQNMDRTQSHQTGVSKSESIVAQIKFGMAAAAARGEKHVTIQLHPKELGTIDVHMKISAGKGAEITMLADKADTASMLQREAQSLKDALNDALKNQNTQLNFAFREGDHGQSKQQGSGQFIPGVHGNGITAGEGEQVMPLHQLQISMEEGVNLVI